MKLTPEERMLIIDALQINHTNCIMAALKEKDEKRRKYLIVTAKKCKELIGRLYEQ